MLALTLEQLAHESKLEGLAEGKQELATQLTTLNQLIEGRADKDEILSYALANTSEITDLINRYQNLVISG